jgi:hypothetical protein
MNRSIATGFVCRSVGACSVALVALGAGALVALSACGSKEPPPKSATGNERASNVGDAGFDDQSRCDWRGRTDREVSETAGPGAVAPNVRRVYQIVGTGEDAHKVLICREVDTNLDGIKDVVRTYNEKGESLHEEADSNYDGKIDTWITFAGGRISKEQLDTDFDGQPDTWKYYVGGALSRIQRDTNKDGKPDRWEFYTDGRLERMGVDLDFDGHVDRWDHDELAKAAEEAAEAKKNASSGVAADGGAPSAAGPDAGRSDVADAGPKKSKRNR